MGNSLFLAGAIPMTEMCCPGRQTKLHLGMAFTAMNKIKRIPVAGPFYGLVEWQIR